MNVADSTCAGLRAALAAWADDPVLAAPLADSARPVLVLDGTATTVLHASTAAVPLRDAVSDASGALSPALAGQIRAVGGTPRPRLVRLRLDPRRIAPPTACLIAGGTLDGAPALLLVVTGPLPGLRPRPARAGTPPPADGPTPVPASAEGPAAAEHAAPAAGSRFVWQSDAADRLVRVAGPSFDALATRLVGRSWAELAQAGPLHEADAFLAAVGARRTFRALSAVLDAGDAGTLTLALSGAGRGRGGDAFAGFDGYGVVRAVTAPAAADPVTPPAVASDADDPAPVAPRRVADDAPATEAGSDRPDGGGAEADHALPDIRDAAWPPAVAAAERLGEASSAELVPADDPWAGARGPAPSGRPVAAVPTATAPPVSGSSSPAEGPAAVQEGAEAALSVTEHAAFREIARALGARYAGDDERRDPAETAGGRGEGGAVMPFPALRAVEAEKAAGFPSPLDDLPVALLIHRGDAVLGANRRLLDLTGYADLASLRAAGLGRLLPGLPPDGDAAGASEPGGPRVVVTAQGAGRPVAVERGPAAWEGRPAACLILRPVAEADPAREAAAEHLARSFRDGHAAEARRTLDALDDGVVTFDPGGRIVAMNRAAAGLFACDPREVVGTAFEALFEASERDAVRAGLEGLGTGTPVAAGGRPLVLHVSGRDGTRVALLRTSPGDTTRTAPGFDRPAFLMRLDREIRTPVEGIVGLADGILAEPHGPVDERYRAPLHAIRAAGDHVRGLVSDLIDIATIESGGLALAVRPLPLNDLVSGCVDLLQPEAARGRIVLRTSFSPDLAPLEADEPTLRQAALTVIGDAIRATAAGGQVIVSTALGEQGGVALKVRGTGPGARSAETEGPHEPRIGGGVRGNGLGLPLTKALVEANHGVLRISSRGNEGTLVEILLPGPVSRTA